MTDVLVRNEVTVDGEGKLVFGGKEQPLLQAEHNALNAIISGQADYAEIGLLGELIETSKASGLDQMSQVLGKIVHDYFECLAISNG